jgi:hypothetical protein
MEVGGRYPGASDAVGTTFVVSLACFLRSDCREATARTRRRRDECGLEGLSI